MSSGNESNGNRQFASTQWSIVRAVGNGDRDAAKSALQELCKLYWYPLYSFVRYQGHDSNAAADMTQAFFADILEREDLKRVDPKLGKFRSFLLASLKNFLRNQYDQENALKRGGGKRILSLDFASADQRFQREPVAHQDSGKTPEQMFERQWAQTLLEQVNSSLRKEYEERGRAHQFDRLNMFLAGKVADDSIAMAAEQLEISEVAAKVAIHRMRRRYGELLRLEILSTVGDVSEVEQEISQLFEALKS